MIIQHNMQAMNANRMLGNVVTTQSKSTEKLSSGYRINRAGDDAAGLAISEKMRAQIRGLSQASTNAQDGISLIQTAEGALTETHSILQRMRELAVQASNDTNTDDDRTQIQNEIDQLTQEVDRIATTTEFNTKKLLDGSRVGAVSEKAGSINVDSTFANSNVSALVTTDGSAKASFTDVIRIEITKDFKEGQSTEGISKLSDNAIKDIYEVLTSGSMDSDEFKLDMTYATATAPNTQTATKTADNSLSEAITDAIAAEKIELIEMKSASTTADGNVEKNADLMEAHFEKLDKYNTDIKNASESKEDTKYGIFAEGVTIDDVKAAFEKYVNLLVEDGTLAGGTLGQDTAAGVSDAITAAENELKALFYTGTDTAKAATATSAGDYFNFADLVTADSTAGKVTDKDTSIANSSTSIKDYADATVASFIIAAKQVAGTKIEAGKYASDVEKQQKLVDTLSDTELTTAIYNYHKEDAAYTTLKGTGTATDSALKEQAAKVAELKTELDKLNKNEDVMRVTDLFGNAEGGKDFNIASKVADNGDLTITITNKGDKDTVITLGNADQLRAGDVLTITAGAMVESKSAATGRDALRLQAGANAGQEISLGINSMKAVDLNIVQTKEGVEGKALDVSTQSTATLAIKAYDLAIQQVSTERAKMGATQNRLEHTINNLDTSEENLQAAESRIRDVDMAKEMTTYSKNNILTQAAQSMLAQANQSTQGVLSLLR